MISTKIERTGAVNAGALFLQHIFNYFLRKQRKTHNYAHYQCGVDYFFEVTACGTQAYMTGQGKGIKANDYLILQLKESLERYQIETIDYYASPSDTWTALLTRVF